jgi:hypothetical protein
MIAAPSSSSVYLKNKSDNKIYDRKCDIKWISDLEYKDFCEKNHLQNEI